MISVVVPVYDEADCLPDNVQAFKTRLEEESPGAWEIVLVNDGSSDGTGPLINELSAADDRVRAAHHDVNQGKGAAIRTGVGITRGDRVLFSDADLSTPLETMTPFLAAIENGADIVVGNRKSHDATIEVSQPKLRVFLGLGFTRLANAVTGLDVRDYTCGFKLFKGDLARKIFSELGTTRWCFDVEVLARAAREGAHVVEIPVRWRDMPDTRVRVLRDIVQSFLELYTIRRRLGRVPRRRP